MLNCLHSALSTHHAKVHLRRIASRCRLHTPCKYISLMALEAVPRGSEITPFAYGRRPVCVDYCSGCGSPAGSTGAATSPEPSVAESVAPSAQVVTGADASAKAPPRLPRQTPPRSRPTSVSPSVAASAQAELLGPEALAERLRPATVRVIAEFGASAVAPEGLGAGSGAGADLRERLHYHQCPRRRRRFGRQSRARRQRQDPSGARSWPFQCDDLAVLQVDNTEGLAAAALGDSSAARVGADVVALGYPLSFDLGNDLSVNVGNISQLNAQLGKFQDLIKVDAINHGNSGGPLVNASGEVVGINTLGFEGTQNQNYAIAMSYARPIVEQLAQGKNRNHIGMNLVPNAYADYFGTSDGMVVVGVSSGSPASRSGVAQADLLLEVEGKAISSEEALCDVLRSHSDGDHLNLTVLRADSGELLQGEVVIDQSGDSAAAGRPLAVVGTLQRDEQPAADNSGQAGASGQDPNAVYSQATVVEVEALAIRAEPNRSSALLGEVPRGGVVDVLCQEPVDADGRVLVKARSGGIEGYRAPTIWNSLRK